MNAQSRIKWYKVYDSKQSAEDAVGEGAIVKVLLNNKYVCFSKVGDEFYAFGDSCPHQGKPLVQAKCDENAQVICPFHQYKFDLKTGRGQGLYLPIYPVEVREDGVYVGKEKSAWEIF